MQSAGAKKETRATKVVVGLNAASLNHLSLSLALLLHSHPWKLTVAHFQDRDQRREQLQKGKGWGGRSDDNGGGSAAHPNL
jgi:hypothetical protein